MPNEHLIIEIDRRRRNELRRSLRNPHPETEQTVEHGFEQWSQQLPTDCDGLLDPDTGIDVRWTPGEGWIEVDP